MYSETIAPKVEQMFADLRKKAAQIIQESKTAKEAIDGIVEAVSLETSSRSKSILSDMLFDLSDRLFETPAFAADISLRNKFTEMNLRQEILDKYQFTAEKVDYQEASRALQALGAGGATLLGGGLIEIGYVLIKGLKFSSLVPLPVGVLVGAALGAALVDYFLAKPTKSKKEFKKVVDKYLLETQKQFLLWFDEVERYFGERVEAFQQTV